MPRATRIVLAAPASWDEAQLIDATRALDPLEGAVHVGDLFGELVAVLVEPSTGAEADSDTDVEVTPHTPRAGGRHAVAILLDTAASMALPWSDDLSRIDAGRYAISTLLPRLTPVADSVTLYSFDKVLRRHAGPAPATAITGLAPMKAEGPSRLSGAVDLVVAKLAADRTKPASVLVAADTADDLARTRRAAERAARLGITVHVLSLAPTNDAALEELARGTGGAFQPAVVPPSFRAIHTRMCEMVGVAAEWSEPRFPRPGEPEHAKLRAQPRPNLIDQLRQWRRTEERSP